MSTDTQIFALIGNPVEHSLSPLMHNATFAEMGIDARYMALRAEKVEDALQAIRESNIRGGSITIPHKTSFMAYLDNVSEACRKIGAVNTFTCDDGRLTGNNTDWIGIVRALKELIPLEGKTFAVLGAGGAARAAVYGIREERGIPIVLNRTVTTGKDVAGEFGCDFSPLQDIEKITADCLINCTSVGLYPDTGVSPVRKNVLRNFGYVMDIIYNPLKTRLMKDAEEVGCSTISGLSMFVHQGAEQIYIWTGMTPPHNFMKKVVMEKLNDEGN